MNNPKLTNVTDVIREARGVSDTTHFRTKDVLNFIREHKLEVLVEQPYGRGCMRLVDKEAADLLLERLRSKKTTRAQPTGDGSPLSKLVERLECRLEGQVDQLRAQLKENAVALNLLIQSQNRLNDQLNAVLRELGSPSVAAA